MELPVVDARGELPHAALVRAVRRVAVALGRTGAVEVDVDGATCLISSQRPGVRALNFAEHVMIDADANPDPLLDRIDAAFADHGSACHAWTSDGEVPANLEEALMRRGHRHVERHVLVLNPAAPRLSADESVQIIPVRAAYQDAWRFYRTKAMESHVADPEAESDLVEALASASIDRLDEPRLELSFVRCNGEAVAVAGVFTLGEIGVISPAYCRMAHRGKGVALALMASVLEHCRRSLFKHVIVDRSDSCPAIAFYERLGFSRVASYRRYRRAVQ